jgi:adenylate cyclase
MINADKNRQRGETDNGEPMSRQLVRALSHHKRTGVILAFRARTAALLAIAIFLPFVAPWPNVLWPELFVVVFIMLGILQRRAGRVGRSRYELFLILCDYLLLTALVVLPNPLAPMPPPAPMSYRFGIFIYFFIFLAAATISMNWKTISTIGVAAPAIWLLGVIFVWLSFQPVAEPWAIHIPPGFDANVAELLNPSALNWDIRLQEILAFAIVAAILVVTARRNEQLLERFANAERERSNLSRYFSPNVVEELASVDDPLGRTQVQPVAVMFVDIVGFTLYARTAQPVEVMATLRAFFARMEKIVFAHRGTLDKYLGDGLMATFGTPSTGVGDALNCVRCAEALLADIVQWNEDRHREGLAAIKIGIGAHFGDVVLGNIGINRLEFAVIGDTVNVASRLEKLTRTLQTDLAISRSLHERAESDANAIFESLTPFIPRGSHQITGTTASVDVMTFSIADPKANP